MKIKKTVEINAERIIREEDLEAAAGGVGATWDCWFQGGGGFSGDLQWLGCTRGSCFKGLTQCACHGTDRCINKMHKMDTEKMQYFGPVYYGREQKANIFPYPMEQYDHGSKPKTSWMPV